MKKNLVVLSILLFASCLLAKSLNNKHNLVRNYLKNSKKHLYSTTTEAIDTFLS